MREILFRGKRVDGTIEWVYGGYTEWGLVQSVITTKGKYGENNAYEVDPKTVGQWTGLVDMNGVKIFEGDVVLTKYGRACIVEWFEPKLCFDLQPLDNPETLRNRAPDPWDVWYAENLEVIGNVYDGYKLPQVTV